MLRACARRPVLASLSRPAIVAMPRACPPSSLRPAQKPVSAVSTLTLRMPMSSIPRISLSVPSRFFASAPSAPKPPASQSQSSSSAPPPVDLLAKYEQKAARRKRLFKWGIFLFLIVAIFALIMWYGEGHRASKDIMESVGALQDPSTHKEPALYHLRKLYERARTNEHWMQAVRAETVGLLEILRPFLTSANKDERIYAALLVSYIAGGSRTQKKAIIDGGYLDLMLQYTDTPTRVATAITLSQIATRWFAGEMKSIFRDNEAVVKFVAEAAEDHEPLLQAYAKRIMYHSGQKSLGRQVSASNDLLIKAFDYTQKTDKESMAAAMREAATGEPKNAYLQFCQAYWFHLMGFAKEAKIAYTKSLQLNPGQVDSLYELGRIYLVEFHADRTALLWARALQENPNFPPLNRWIDEYESKRDATRPDLEKVYVTLSALRSGSEVTLAKAAPLIPAEITGAPLPSAAPAVTPTPTVSAVASAIVPSLGAGPRPAHVPPPSQSATQQASS